MSDDDWVELEEGFYILEESGKGSSTGEMSKQADESYRAIQEAFKDVELMTDETEDTDEDLDDLIDLARTDVPRLADAVEQLVERVQELEGYVDMLETEIPDERLDYFKPFTKEGSFIQEDNDE